METLASTRAGPWSDNWSGGHSGSCSGAKLSGWLSCSYYYPGRLATIRAALVEVGAVSAVVVASDQGEKKEGIRDINPTSLTREFFFFLFHFLISYFFFFWLFFFCFFSFPVSPSVREKICWQKRIGKQIMVVKGRAVVDDISEID